MGGVIIKRLNKKSGLGVSALKLTLSQVVATLITLVISMLLSRFRTLEEYGTFSQMTLVINLFTAMIMLGLPNSLNYFLAKADSDIERTEFLSVYYSISTVFSLFVGVVLVAITPLLVIYFNNPLLKGFLYYLALYPWTKIICSGIENILIVYQKSNGIVAFRIAHSIATLGVVVFVQLMQWSFTVYIILYLLVEVSFTILVYTIAYRLSHGLRLKFNKNLLKKIFVFSVPIGIASMIGTLNIEIDKLMMGALLDTERFAIYTNASKELPLTIIATSITAVLLPQIVRLLKNNDADGIVKLWGSAIKISFSILCFFSLALFVFAPQVITVLYSEKYLAGVPIFRVYSLVLLCRFTYSGMILSSAGKTKLIMYSSIASLCLNAALNYLLFLLFDWVGPALATLLAIIIILLFQAFFSAKTLKVPFSKIFPWLNMLRVLIVQAGIAIGMYFVSKYIFLEEWFGQLFNISLSNGAVIEAMLLGVVWLALFVLIEFKPMKKSWQELNSNEKRTDSIVKEDC